MVKCLRTYLLVIFAGLLGCMQELAAVEVNDDHGHTVNLPQPARKIVALSPHLAELVFDAGAGHNLVGTVEYADFPEQAGSITRLGSYNALDIERLYSMKPDLVLAWYSGNGERVINKIRQLGIPVYISEPRQLSDVSHTLRSIGLLAHTEKVAESSAQQFDRRLNDLRQHYVRSKPLSVFYQVWEQPLITINGEQLINEVIKLCGGVNVFADVPVLAPVVSAEEVMVKNPRVIIGGAREDEKQHWIYQWQQWSSIDAVKNDHYYFINPDLLNRQTARILNGANQVCEILDKVRQQYND